MSWNDLGCHTVSSSPSQPTVLNGHRLLILLNWWPELSHRSLGRGRGAWCLLCGLPRGAL